MSVKEASWRSRDRRCGLIEEEEERMNGAQLREKMRTGGAGIRHDDQSGPQPPLGRPSSGGSGSTTSSSTPSIRPPGTSGDSRSGAGLPGCRSVSGLSASKTPSHTPRSWRSCRFFTGVLGALLRENRTRRAELLNESARFSATAEREFALPRARCRAVSQRGQPSVSRTAQQRCRGHYWHRERSGSREPRRHPERRRNRAIFIGLGHLSVSLGIPDEYTHPRFVEDTDDIIFSPRSSGVLLGGHWQTEELVNFWMARGSRWISTAPTCAR